MTLRKRFILSIIEAISIVTIIIIALTYFLFEANFNNYIRDVKEKKFDIISKDIENKLKNSSISEISDLLENYATTENIEIMIVNKYNSKQIIFNELDRSSGVAIITKTFYLESENTFEGLMNVSYYDTLKRDDLQNDFFKRLSFTIVLSVFVTLITGSIAAALISKQLADPITQINNMALDFKNKKYKTKELKKCNIKEIEQLKLSMEYLGSSLHQQEEIRRKYAQDISHELRTPLTSLKLHIEGILDGVIDKTRENFEAMSIEIDYLTDLVEKLRETFTSSNTIDSSKDELTRIDLIIYDTISLFNASAKAKLIKLECKTEEMTSRINKNKMLQVLNNIISNAINACKENDTINVNLSLDKDMYLIVIKDEGIGIDKKDINRIFDRFFRTEESKAKNSKGSGLGLSITKSIVESMGGNIQVESTKGKGTTFTLNFKIKR